VRALLDLLLMAVTFAAGAGYGSRLRRAHAAAGPCEEENTRG
jgi:hypothetical protein